MQKINYMVMPVLVMGGAGLFTFFSFTTEDAYITYRYAENLVNIGKLVYYNANPAPHTLRATIQPVH